MKPRHPIQGLDAGSTPNRDHAREADAVASLTIALVTLAALAAIAVVATAYYR